MAEPARNCRSPLPRSVQHELIFGAPLRCAMAYGVRCYCSAPLHGCDEGTGELGKHSRKRPVCPRFSKLPFLMTYTEVRNSVLNIGVRRILTCNSSELKPFLSISSNHVSFSNELGTGGPSR